MMHKTLTTFFFLFFSGLTINLLAAPDFSVVKDFGVEWKVYQKDQFVSFDQHEGNVSTVYFQLDATKFPGTFLWISSPETFAVFINGELISKKNKTVRFSIDSLRELMQVPVLQVGIHQDRIYGGGLKTFVQSRVDIPPNSLVSESLRFSPFRDFAVMGMLVLMIMLIVIIQLNPKLAADYFSIARIFSMREGDDTQAYSRIASSINILFYAYCSLMLGYYLMIIFHFLPMHYPTALSFQAATFWEAVVQWLKLSLIIMALFFFKIILVYSLSYVFGIREIGGIHFFNWVRLLLGFFGVLTIILFLYFTTHGRSEGFYTFLLHAMGWILAGWTFLIVLKLHRQLSHSMFHLFSYICATELIPFLITIKVLYY